MASASGWSSESSTDPDPPPRRGLLARLVDVHPGEGLTLALSLAYFFTLLAGYSILKPIREAVGLSGGAERLPALFTGTLVAMILVNPLFAWLMTRVERRVFIPTVYAASIAGLLAFRLAFALVPESHELWVGYPYFVFISVFNLFVVSVFWGFMADLWRLEQAKRLYGFIGVGGTVGAIVGASTTTWLATRLGSFNLLYLSAGMLALSIVCITLLMRLHKIDRPGERLRQEDEARIGDEVVAARTTDIWRGMKLVWRNPYLRTIATYTFLYGLLGTFLYFQQGNLVDRTIPARDERTRYFGMVDMLAQSLTLFVQLFFTGRLIRRFGITFALNTQPVIALAGCIALVLAMHFAPQMAAAGLTFGGFVPELSVLVVVLVLLRASNFATARPARESLYTVVSREMKYKSKSFIDTFVYRLADGTGAWSFRWLQLAGMALSGLAVVTVPIAAAWIFVGRALGRRQRELVAARDAALTDGNQTSASKSDATA